jgi:hypothetical protein
MKPNESARPQSAPEKTTSQSVAAGPGAVNSMFRRPGVSDEFLARAGCRHVGADECVQKYGFRAEGIVIPFRFANGEPITDNDRPFARNRLYQATDEQKYHQRPGSGIHVYIPPTFDQSTKGSRLHITEGEFKAMSLAEAGYAAVGLCGFTGAARKTTGAGGKQDYALNEELVDILKTHQPAQIVFLGDADVVLNAQFAVEAAKFRRLLFTSKQFSFIEKFTVAKLPLIGAKGIDDLRAEKGDGFGECFEGILSDGYDVPAKVSATEIFATLLDRENKSVKRLISKRDHEGSRARVRLLQSAAQLWNDPGAKLELKPLLANVFGAKQSAVATLIRDAGGDRNRTQTNAAKENAPASSASVIEPWDKAVDGNELLDELRVTYRRFIVLPPHGDVLLAVWTLHTFLFDQFSFTPYLHVISPERECGKSTLAELMYHLCANATTPGGMSAAAMYRRIERVRPTLLLDEWDSLSDENRQAAMNALNTGFKWNGVYVICVGDDHEDRDFHTFCPKAIFGLSEAKLADTTKSRCFVFPMAKKLPSENVEKLTRKFDGLILRRKCLRWANDTRDKLNTEPVMPPGLSARQEDFSEPLLAIADFCGGQWPGIVRDAILHFCGEAEVEDGDVKRELLKDIREGFSKQPQPDRFSSAAVRDHLRSLEHRQWQDWNDGKGINQRQISDRLRSYRIASHNIRIADGKVVKGYYLADFQEAFDRYLSPDRESIRYLATTPKTIADSPLLQSATAEHRSGSEKGENANEITGGSGVADGKPGTAEMLI